MNPNEVRSPSQHAYTIRMSIYDIRADHMRMSGRSIEWAMHSEWFGVSFGRNERHIIAVVFRLLQWCACAENSQFYGCIFGRQSHHHVWFFVSFLRFGSHWRCLIVYHVSYGYTTYSRYSRINSLAYINESGEMIGMAKYGSLNMANKMNSICASVTIISFHFQQIRFCGTHGIVNSIYDVTKTNRRYAHITAHIKTR